MPRPGPTTRPTLPARTGRGWIWLAMVVAVLLAPACGMVREVEDSAQSTEGRSVYPGDRGASVAALQRDLRILGFELTIDGAYDASTRAAVETVQSYFELTVDGIVGPATRAVLDERLAEADLTPLPLESMPDLDVLVNTTAEEHCFETLVGDAGGSACLGVGVEHVAVRYVDLDLGPEVAPDVGLLVGVAGSGAEVVTTFDAGPSGETRPIGLVPVVGRDGDGAFAALDPGIGSHALIVTDASGAEVQRIALSSDPAADLAVGAVGTAVLTWQRRLVDAGVDVAVNGVFSFDMAEDIAAVQTFVGMEPTGVLDQPTRALFAVAPDA
jgi:peptidoglycan hydrolase-like protein with peptidoglycan-binding domain